MDKWILTCVLFCSRLLVRQGVDFERLKTIAETKFFYPFTPYDSRSHFGRIGVLVEYGKARQPTVAARTLTGVRPQRASSHDTRSHPVSSSQATISLDDRTCTARATGA